MRFKKLRITILIALFLFVIIIAGIFSFTLIEQKEIVSSPDTASKIGDSLIVSTVKDEQAVIVQETTTTSASPTKKVTTTTNTATTTTVKQPIHRVVTTRAS